MGHPRHKPPLERRRAAVLKLPRIASSVIAQMIIWTSLTGILLLPCGPGAGWAQVAAAVSGRVHDVSGAAIAGVAITLTSRETGAARVVRTDEAGNFRILGLAVGGAMN